MAVIHETAAALRFWGDELDPHEVTRLMGATPTSAVSKGELIAGRASRTARSGRWSLTVNRRQPGDLSGQIADILSGLTQDLDVWRDLSGRFRGCIFVGFFMSEGNEGYDLSSETLKLLTDRGLSVLLDVYSGQNEDDRQFTTLTVLTSSTNGGYLKLRRMDADRVQIEAGNEHFRGQTECYIAFIDSPAVLFTEMAGEWRGWDGTKTWSDREGALELSAKTDSLGHILLDVALRGTDHSSRLHVTLVLDAGQLEDIANRVSKAVR
ncbi:DUF6228 family protein [Devosia riboflavina]